MPWRETASKREREREMVGSSSLVVLGLGGGIVGWRRISSLGNNNDLKSGNWKWCEGSSNRRRRLSCRCQLAAADVTAAAYGSLLLGGGLFAFSKSGSKGSLYGGLAGAALMAATYSLMQAQETRAFGEALGFGSCLLFSSVFGIRLAATRKLVPAGPLLGLSVGALALFVAAYLQDM